MGRWVEIERTWHDTALTNCTLCGRLVPRRAWMVEFNGQELPFCNEECEGLYRTYWLPKYGAVHAQTSPSPGSTGDSSLPGGRLGREPGAGG